MLGFYNGLSFQLFMIDIYQIFSILSSRTDVAEGPGQVFLASVWSTHHKLSAEFFEDSQIPYPSPPSSEFFFFYCKETVGLGEIWGLRVWGSSCG